MNYAQSILANGSTGAIVQVECQLSNGLPSIIIVGLGNKAIDEAKERIRSAFASTRIELPRKRITINLAPADLPKESTSLDLAIAIAIMQSSGNKKTPILDSQTAIIGEISLAGDVRPVRGIIGKLLTGQKLGMKRFIIPAANIQQALLVPDVELFPITSITELDKQLVKQDRKVTAPDIIFKTGPSIMEIAGQAQAKRALEIAAAGGHNILLSGPPGTGKSMLAKTLPSLLPPLSHQEMLEVTHLHSLASNKYDELITTRPFRSPHHSSSHTSIVGGGPMSKPGEVTLSHRGVLFLDEMPEFARTTLESMRQPLEDKQITIARARQTIEYPADFILVATANPCPCGFYGTHKECTCSPGQIQRYAARLSGPIIDRIDLHVSVDTVEHDKLLNTNSADETDQEIRQRIANARLAQHRRLDSQEKTNSGMDNQAVKKYALLESASRDLINHAATRLTLSARSYMRLIKVARTIADLESSPSIKPHHVSEALQYRTSRVQ